MKQCKHISELLSEYTDAEVSEQERQEIEAHLDECAECSSELVGLRRSIRLLKSLPMPEPTIDIWPEFVPKLAHAEAEMKLGPMLRFERAWQHAASRFAEGLVVYTHILAQNTLRRMEKYLISDPFEVAE